MNDALPPDDATPPVVKSIPLHGVESAIPEITGLSYEEGKLRVSLRFPTDGLAFAEFEIVRGFRVLDEGDLLEFWDPDIRAEGWLWEVEQGGWLTQERRRSGFLSGIAATYREFLVLGQNDCVSVFADREPRIRRDSSHPSH